MTSELTKDYVKDHSLFDCLSTFDGAYENKTVSKEDSLLAPFSTLAQKMIFGGFLRVRDEYAIFIHTVEFYYHEEEPLKEKVLEDEIVYHRDRRYENREVPYFPVMSLHSHWSGFDITFENEIKHYRASALIRKYVVFDLKKHLFIQLDTSFNKDHSKSPYFIGKVINSEMPFIDDRSSFLQYYLNGFSINGKASDILWQENDAAEFLNVESVARRNAGSRKWAFRCDNKNDYIAYICRCKSSL
jgi:hypothetical protein